MIGRATNWLDAVVWMEPTEFIMNFRVGSHDSVLGMKPENLERYRTNDPCLFPADSGFLF